MFGIIDRFEGNFVIVELYDGKVISISKSKIPEDAKEGDVLSIRDCIIIDYEQTKKRKSIIDDLSDDMWK
jgi:hypothetical protein